MPSGVDAPSPPDPHEITTIPSTDSTRPTACDRVSRCRRNSHSSAATIAGIVPSTTADTATVTRSWPALNRRWNPAEPPRPHSTTRAVARIDRAPTPRLHRHHGDEGDRRHDHPAGRQGVGGEVAEDELDQRERHAADRDGTGHERERGPRPEFLAVSPTWVTHPCHPPASEARNVEVAATICAWASWRGTVGSPSPPWSP